MKSLIFLSNKDAVSVASRAMFLAYNESLVFGMGILQAQNNKTENEVFNNILYKQDYPGSITQPPDMTNIRLHADYVFGRMMKLSITINNNTIQYSDDKPNSGYQSWAYTYKSYDKLFKTAMKELNIKNVEPVPTIPLS